MNRLSSFSDGLESKHPYADGYNNGVLSGVSVVFRALRNILREGGVLSEENVSLVEGCFSEVCGKINPCSEKDGYGIRDVSCTQDPVCEKYMDGCADGLLTGVSFTLKAIRGSMKNGTIKACELDEIQEDVMKEALGFVAASNALKM